MKNKVNDTIECYMNNEITENEALITLLGHIARNLEEINQKLSEKQMTTITNPYPLDVEPHLPDDLSWPYFDYPINLLPDDFSEEDFSRGAIDDGSLEDINYDYSFIDKAIAELYEQDN